mmetsp:Transcript_21072/g.33662  ORF Transcript_21072/g.33662 Transcript_21072/m.33662 type:complete len:355 (-) Transcript_21072:126-1190(-)
MDTQQNNDNDEESEPSSDNDSHLYQYNGGMSMGHMSQSMEDIELDDLQSHGNQPQYDDEDYCFACGDGGNLLICDIKDCMKVWHIHCAGLTKMPQEDRWYCPSHTCCACKQQQLEQLQSSKKYMCTYCGNAYCDKHVPVECTKYQYKDVEFLCETCLSQRTDGELAYKFASERFMSRLMELHKRKRSHLNRINHGDDKSRKYTIPEHCKIGRTEIEWFTLYCAVIEVGGLSKIRELKGWDAVRKKCELTKNFQGENVWRSLRDDYIEYLYAYEKQYYPLTDHVLPRGIQTIVDNKGALDGLFLDDGEEEEQKQQQDGKNIHEAAGGAGKDVNDEDVEMAQDKTPENTDTLMLVD